MKSIGILIFLGMIPYIVLFFTKIPETVGNHGPWRGTIRGMTIIYPIFFYLIIYYIKTIFGKNKWWEYIILILLGIGFIYLELVTLFWLVD